MQQHTFQQDEEIAQKPVPVIVRQISIKSAQISWISDHNEVIISVKYQNFQIQEQTDQNLQITGSYG
jgi:hypothetical protein